MRGGRYMERWEEEILGGGGKGMRKKAGKEGMFRRIRGRRGRKDKY